jgi:hypothetical protein
METVARVAAGVAAMLSVPEDWPPKSILGSVPLAMTAEQRWEVRMKMARERRAKEKGDKHDER